MSEITQITQQIYLSGVYPMDNVGLIKKLGIRYILSCVNREYISDIHDKIMINNPNITILYLPYHDDISQNLWGINDNKIKLMKYSKNINDYNQTSNKLHLYHKKPMIEIGYHFIDDVVSSGNKILIHCIAGVSRSVSLLAYYFMKKYGADYNTVLNNIRKKRRIANPNDSFRSQLMLYQIKRDKFNEKDASNIIKNLDNNRRIEKKIQGKMIESLPMINIKSGYKN